MPSIDLNCDLGESFGAYTIGMDAEILPYVTSANIACGFHAGDPSVMQKSVLLCKKYGVQVGAHPGLPDLQGFGRRRMAISPAEAEADVMYQIGALKAFCDAAGVPLHHVKPHGALYNMAAKDPVLAAAICRAVQAAAPGAVLLALSGSEMVKAANAIGLPVASEVFADRGSRTIGYAPPDGLGKGLNIPPRQLMRDKLQYSIEGICCQLDIPLRYVPLAVVVARVRAYCAMGSS